MLQDKIQVLLKKEPERSIKRLNSSLKLEKYCYVQISIWFTISFATFCQCLSKSLYRQNIFSVSKTNHSHDFDFGVFFSFQPNNFVVGRKCRALYDCEADNEDELTFEEGDIILVINEDTEDDNWMEGCLMTDPGKRGLFPVSFVNMLELDS